MPFLLFGAAATGGAAAGAGLFGAGGAFVASTALVSTAIIGGTILAAQAGRQADKTAEAIAEQNAENLRVQGVQETEAATEAGQQVRKEGERRKARLRVLAANAGISLVGTPLLIEETIAGETEEEFQFNAQGGRQRRFGLESRAAIEEFRAGGIRRASPFRTGATLATGFGTALSVQQREGRRF